MKKLKTKYNITSQLIYDILVLGLTKIDDRPKCPICGKPIRFRNNLIGKYCGYGKTCSNKCHLILYEDKFRSEDSIKKSVETRMKNGGYDHMFGNTYGKGISRSEESRLSQSLKMKGRKRSSESIAKQTKTLSEYFKNNPDKLIKFVNSPKGKSKRGSLMLKKSKITNFSYLSSWEELLLVYLDNELDDVIEINVPIGISYTYEDREHYYYADIDITLSNGKKLLIEIKPSAHLYHKKNQAKFKAGKDFVMNDKNYLDYVILTEKELFENPRKQTILNKQSIDKIIKDYNY